MRYYAELPTMAGLLRIVEENDAIVQIQFEQEQKTAGDAALQDTPLLLEAKRQLEEYFAGLRASFSLPLNPQGTAFQKKVWQQLEAIPYAKPAPMARLQPLLVNPQPAEQ